MPILGAAKSLMGGDFGSKVISAGQDAASGWVGSAVSRGLAAAERTVAGSAGRDRGKDERAYREAAHPNVSDSARATATPQSPARPSRADVGRQHAHERQLETIRALGNALENLGTDSSPQLLRLILELSGVPRERLDSIQDLGIRGHGERQQFQASQRDLDRDVTRRGQDVAAGAQVDAAVAAASIQASAQESIAANRLSLDELNSYVDRIAKLAETEALAKGFGGEIVRSWRAFFSDASPVLKMVAGTALLGVPPLVAARAAGMSVSALTRGTRAVTSRRGWSEVKQAWRALTRDPRPAARPIGARIGPGPRVSYKGKPYVPRNNYPPPASTGVKYQTPGKIIERRSRRSTGYRQ